MKNIKKLTDEHKARLRRRIEDQLRKDSSFLLAVIITAVKMDRIKTD